MTLTNFLKSEVKTSAEALVRNLVAKMKKATAADSVLAIMVAGAVKALSAMGMTEEIRQLGLLIVCHFASKCEEVPAEISGLFEASPAKPAVVQQTTIADRAPTSPPMQPPSSPVAPPRKLNEEADESAEGILQSWVKALEKAREGKDAPWKALQSLTAKVFASHVEIVGEQWELFFSVLKVANGCGQHVVNNETKPAEVFARAPKDLLSDLLFGLDGLVPAVTGEIRDYTGSLPGWLCAKTSIILDAIEAVDNEEELGEQEAKLFGNLLRAIEDRHGPNWLVRKGNRIWGPDSPASQPATDKLGNAARIVGNLSLAAKSSDNGHKPQTPEEHRKLQEEEARRLALAESAKKAKSGISEALALVN